MAHNEMTHRLQGTGLETFICQPGMTSTPVYRKTDKSQVLANVLDAAQKVMGQTEERGAIPLMYTATAPELAGLHQPLTLLALFKYTFLQAAVHAS